MDPVCGGDRRRGQSARWSAREVLAVHLERVERVESTVHAFPTLTPEIAEAQADAVDEKVARGLDPGPLAGVPIGIKDMLLTAGVRTTFGSVMFENNVPDVDEPVVRQVRDAGAVMLGKTNVPEFAFSSVGHNPIFETTTNPWDPSKTSGGSSAGSAAAIAAGECPIALGTDRAGSIRIPAAHCGIVGFKPTKGIVPDNGTNDSRRRRDRWPVPSKQRKMSRYIFQFQIPVLPERRLSRDRGAQIARALRGGSYVREVWTPEELDHYRDAFDEPRKLHGPLAYYRTGFRNAVLRRRVGLGGPVEVPTLVVWGMHDRFLSQRFADEDDLRRYATDVTVARIEEAGHFVQNEAPERVNEELLRWLSR